MSARLESEANAMFPILLGTGQRDHTAWAKRIMYRHDHGDKDLLLVQTQFAKMALNIEDKAAA